MRRARSSICWTGVTAPPWQMMDGTLLADTFTPSYSGHVVLGANADLWTEEAGFNQDLGICLEPVSTAPATCPEGYLLGWKEFGGFAGRSHQCRLCAGHLQRGRCHHLHGVHRLEDKHPDARRGHDRRGRGQWPHVLPDAAHGGTAHRANTINGRALGTVYAASSHQQYVLQGSDAGSTWNYVDPVNLVKPSIRTMTIPSRWRPKTPTSGRSMPASTRTSASAWSPAQPCRPGGRPSADVGRLEGKQFGGFAGAFSPNAAFAQALVPVATFDTYGTVALVWKANRPMPSGDQIAMGGARAPVLTDQLDGDESTRLYDTGFAAAPATALSTEQYVMDGGSDGVTWQVLDFAQLTLTVDQAAAGCRADIGGNADLWTFDPGSNQDIGIQVTPAGESPYIAAWKESGGFAGTFSPNAAFVEAVLPISAATSYTISLVWKTQHSHTAGRPHRRGGGPRRCLSLADSTLTVTENAADVILSWRAHRSTRIEEHIECPSRVPNPRGSPPTASRRRARAWSPS